MRAGGQVGWRRMGRVIITGEEARPGSQVPPRAREGVEEGERHGGCSRNTAGVRALASLAGALLLLARLHVQHDGDDDDDYDEDNGGDGVLFLRTEQPPLLPTLRIRTIPLVRVL